MDNETLWDKISQLEMLIVDVKEWINCIDRLLFSEN